MRPPVMVTELQHQHIIHKGQGGGDKQNIGKGGTLVDDFVYPET